MEKDGDWDPSQIKPEDIKVIKRRPRPTKAGSMNRKDYRRVSGDLRDSGAGVGGSINTDHQGPTEKRPTEDRVGG